MLRTLLLILALVIVIGIALVALGVVNLRPAGNGVAIETRDVEVGTTSANVQLPVVRLEDRQVEVPSVGVEKDTQPGSTQLAPAEPAPAQPANAQ